jgi:hypothetical protein
VRFVSTFLAKGLLVLVITSCDSRQDDGVRAWRPNDHDQEDFVNTDGERTMAVSSAIIPLETSSRGVERQSPHRFEGSLSAEAMGAWVTYCVRCHGRVGSGDGPDGSALSVPVFSSVDWQNSRTYADFEEVVLIGRGKMPAFSMSRELLPEIVRLIRRMAAQPVVDDTTTMTSASTRTRTRTTRGVP